MRCLSRFFALVTCVIIAGCSDSGPPMAPVDGSVTFEGKPVAHAMVMFFPQKVPNGQVGFAQTDENGKFSNMRTGESGKGAVVGSHFVTVTEGWPPGKEIPVDGMGMQQSPPRAGWAQKYRDSSSGAIKADVVGGQENHFELDLSQ